ncbi:MAG TPA: phosphatase PAP2-related protein [Ignavibacteriaceae bacterium]|nr:phosphatase PAP2-related protein [Ignavibacteriaceae bacterium]
MGKTDLHLFNKEMIIPGNGIRWKQIFLNKRLSFEFLLSFIIQIIALLVLADFLKFVEQREGVVLNDPVLSLFSPLDLTWIIFGLIYGCLILALISFTKSPVTLTFAFQTYSILIFIRAAAMYAAPFNPPSGMIPLQDPFVEFFGTGMLLTKDLFFSGHTALLFLFFLIEKSKLLKFIFLISAVTTGICLLLQHVHYTLDVIAAPFFSYTVFRLVLKAKQIFYVKL